MPRLAHRPAHTDLVAQHGNFRRFSTIFRPPFTVTTLEFVHNTLLPFSWPARSRLGTAVRGTHAEWTEWTGMTFWQLHGPPRSRPATLSVRSTLYSELSDYGYHPHFAVHHPDLTFESGIYVRPVIYRGSDNVYGDSFYCVYQYLWGRRVTEHRWYCSTPPDLCTYDQIRWISYVCAPSQLTQTVHTMVNLIDPFLHRQIFTVPPPWAATIYNIVL